MVSRVESKFERKPLKMKLSTVGEASGSDVTRDTQVQRLEEIMPVVAAVVVVVVVVVVVEVVVVVVVVVAAAAAAVAVVVIVLVGVLVLVAARSTCRSSRSRNPYLQQLSFI